MQIENRQAHTLFGVVTLFLVLISSKFYAQIFRTKRLFLLNVTREKLREALLYKKRTHKMLMKLTTVRKFASNHPQHSWSIRRLRKNSQKCILLEFLWFCLFSMQNSETFRRKWYSRAFLGFGSSKLDDYDLVSGSGQFLSRP